MSFKRLIPIIALLVLLVLAVTPASAGPIRPDIPAGDVAHIQITLWSREGHPFVEFIKLEGNWAQLEVGHDGFTTGYTSVNVDELVAAILNLNPTGFTLDTPAGLDLDSRDDTMTPIDFCFILSSVNRNYYAGCADRTVTGELYLAWFDSPEHMSGFSRLADDRAVMDLLTNF